MLRTGFVEGVDGVEDMSRGEAPEGADEATEGRQTEDEAGVVSPGVEDVEGEGVGEGAPSMSISFASG